MTRALAKGLALLALAGCGGPLPPAQVSTQYPPGTGTVNKNSPFQTLNSLPPGAANFAPGMAALAPDWASIRLRAF